MTDTVMMERALIVMAVCLVIQTLAIAGGAIAAFVAWRRTRTAIEAQLSELRLRVDRVSETVEHAALTFERSVSAVHEAVDGTREVVRSATAIVSSPKAAVAIGVLRGLRWWRHYRAERRARSAGLQPRLIVHNRR